jgi:hypothetical protein
MGSRRFDLLFVWRAESVDEWTRAGQDRGAGQGEVVDAAKALWA